MRRIATFAAAASTGSTMNASQSLLAATALAAGSDTTTSDTVVAKARDKGYVLACRQMGNGINPGSLRPLPVVAKACAPDRSSLYAQVWDTRKANPGKGKSPFGNYEGFSNTKVDTVVGSLNSLISAGPCPA